MEKKGFFSRVRIQPTVIACLRQSFTRLPRQTRNAFFANGQRFVFVFRTREKDAQKSETNKWNFYCLTTDRTTKPLLKVFVSGYLKKTGEMVQFCNGALWYPRLGSHICLSLLGFCRSRPQTLQDCSTIKTAPCKEKIHDIHTRRMSAIRT